MAIDAIFAGVQRALHSSLDARKKVDRNVARILAGLNLPSHREVERILDHIEDLERDVSDIARRVAALAEEAPPIAASAEDHAER